MRIERTTATVPSTTVTLLQEHRQETDMAATVTTTATIVEIKTNKSYI